MLISEIEHGKKVSFVDTHNRIVATIQKDCSQFIIASKATRMPLYRGVNGAPATIFKGRPRRDRRTYTEDELVKLFNIGFSELGIKANRTNTIACTSDAEIAGTFGSPFYIFPINGFEFSWSQKVDDFGAGFIDDDVYGIIAKYQKNPIKLVKKYGFTDKNFNRALLSGHEINVLGEYYAFDAENEVTQQMYKSIMDIK